MPDTTDPGFRERVISAVFDALQRVGDVELVERNRPSDIDKTVGSALLFFDGDVLGETDLPFSSGRNPIYPMSYVVEIWGAIQGGAGNSGTLINDLWRRTVRTLWTDPQLRQFLSENCIGLRMTQAEFPLIRGKGATKSAAYFMWIELPFEFDPQDP